VRLCLGDHSKAEHLDQAAEEHAPSIQSGLALSVQKYCSVRIVACQCNLKDWNERQQVRQLA
jgi:hypothetical protein